MLEPSAWGGLGWKSPVTDPSYRTTADRQDARHPKPGRSRFTLIALIDLQRCSRS
ncbi:MAG: hypothetical protein AVDCRST_MAG87-1563 [uncultured Thermomicrobiales bacterium]|uniref:Uncharacterized protein n=1 Tax=uncultured Thermomicrobiales bacterium TaxID=1645740 RepID=A0A6J4UUG8_9BACT|nr:MAG: hypothetical protein AVDCRST_MAG87-1563 [uncultured Thermomicrobiales bacterium]